MEKPDRVKREKAWVVVNNAISYQLNVAENFRRSGNRAAADAIFNEVNDLRDVADWLRCD